MQMGAETVKVWVAAMLADFGEDNPSPSLPVAALRRGGCWVVGRVDGALGCADLVGEVGDCVGFDRAAIRSSSRSSMVGFLLVVDAGSVDVECQADEPDDDVGVDQVTQQGVGVLLGQVHGRFPLMVMLPRAISARRAAISSAWLGLSRSMTSMLLPKMSHPSPSLPVNMEGAGGV